jgi:hypothetical protein
VSKRTDKEQPRPRLHAPAPPEGYREGPPEPPEGWRKGEAPAPEGERGVAVIDFYV